MTAQDFRRISPEVSPNRSSLQARLGRSIVQRAREQGDNRRPPAFAAALAGPHHSLLALPQPGHTAPAEIHLVPSFQWVLTGVQGNEWTQYQFQPYKRASSSPSFVSKPSSKRHSLTGSQAHSFCTSSSSCPFRSRKPNMHESCQVHVNLAPTEPLVSCIFQPRLFSLVLM